MIEIYPNLNWEVACPICNRQLTELSSHIVGMNCLSHGTCEHCNDKFYSHLPTGHALYYPFTISEKTKEIYPKDKENWFSKLN
jgi:hypothetical protein